VFARLSAHQRALTDEWMPGARVVSDLGWDAASTTVLHVTHGGRDLIVKAGGEGDHHIGRELDAHLGGFVAEWVDGGRAGQLRHGDRDARLLVVDRVPGALAYRTAAGTSPDVHRQAGALLRTFHGQAIRPGTGDDFGVARALRWSTVVIASTRMRW
jgi:hypothetical protein